MDLMRENTSRKVDALGRISIPKGMRDRLEIDTNEELEFFTMRFENDTYICMRKPSNENVLKAKYEKIASLMNEVGLEVPEEVLSQI